MVKHWAVHIFTSTAFAEVLIWGMIYADQKISV